MGSVLIVEDDDLYRAMYRNCLRLIDPDISTDECLNGYSALQHLLIETPCLVILDLHMPAFDGFDFIEVVKRKHEYAQLPIIVVTSDRDERTHQLLDFPGVQLLYKPVDVKVLDALIGQAIGPVPLSPGRDARSAARAGIEYLIGNEARIQREFAQVFYDMAPCRIAELNQAEQRAATSNPDYSGLREWIHAMRGTSSLIDTANDLPRLVEQLDVAAKSRDLPQIRILVPQLVTALQQIAIDLYRDYNLAEMTQCNDPVN